MKDGLSVLGGGVARAVVVCLQRGHRGDGHDQTVTRIDQLGQQCLRHTQRAQNIGLPHPPPVVQIGVQDCCQTLCTTRVVDQHVDTWDHGRERVDGILVGDVEFESGTTDFLGDLLETIDAASTDHDVESLSCRVRAVASPIPELAPVTTAMRASEEMVMMQS